MNRVLMLLLGATFIFLTGCGGGGGSSPPAVSNSIPVASAGANQNVGTGSLVSLVGGGSDVDGDALTYDWSFISLPAGSQATLSDPTLANPNFTADLAGSYLLSLVVNDGLVSSPPDSISITATDLSQNSAPTADAGQDQHVKTDIPVTLNGSGSDADGDIISYRWEITSAPVESTAMISNPAAANSTFTPDVNGTYILNLFVHDGKVSSSADSMSITATDSSQNALPVANAGADQNVLTGGLVDLDGTGSDADGDVISYNWVFVSVPPGSTAILSNPTVTYPSFTADLEGTYILNLIVFDGLEIGITDSITITASTNINSEWIYPQGATSLNETVWEDTWYTGSAAYAIDGNAVTAWTYHGLGRIKFDLGDIRTVTGISSYWNGDATNGNTVNIYVDGVKVISESMFGAYENIREFPPTTGRYVVYETVALPHNDLQEVASWSEIAEFTVLIQY